MLASTEPRVLSTHLCSLKRLELIELHRVDLLSSEHLLRLKNNLTLWKLHELRLVWKLEPIERTDRLIHGSSNAMARLEACCRRVRILAKAPHGLLLGLLLGLILLLILGLTIILSPVGVGHQTAPRHPTRSFQTTETGIHLILGLGHRRDPQPCFGSFRVWC